MSIKYRSTRGKQNGMSFEQVVLGGLATDKGLFVPETIPTMSMSEIEQVNHRVTLSTSFPFQKLPNYHVSDKIRMNTLHNIDYVISCL